MRSLSAFVLCLLFSAVHVAGAPPAVADPGDLDPTFHVDGRVTTDFDGGEDSANAVVVQDDGRVVAAGSATGGSQDFGVARYEADGTLDATFAADGLVTTDFAGGEDAARGLVVQEDGKIVVVGFATHDSADLAVARYEADGSLDGGFGAGGLVAIDVAEGEDVLMEVAIQDDGKIVAVGSATGDTTDFVAVRLHPDGSLDTTFGGTGLIVTDFDGSSDRAFSVAIQGDGKIVAGGQAFQQNSTRFDFALARYQSDGTLDPGFDGDGLVTTDFGFDDGDDSASDVVVQGDGKIVAAGWSDLAVVIDEEEAFLADHSLARYEPDGSLDLTFGAGGKVTEAISVHSDDNAADLALQDDGKLVTVGFTVTDSVDFSVARWETDGSLDGTFGVGGHVATNFVNEFDRGFGVAIQDDGKIVAAGHTGTEGASDFALARYEGLPEPVPACLTLSVPPRKAWKGKSSTMTAVLADEETGYPLPGRAIRFLVDGKVAAEALTDAAGAATAPAPSSLNATSEVRVEFEGDLGHEPASVETTYQPGTGIDLGCGS